MVKYRDIRLKISEMGYSILEDERPVWRKRYTFEDNDGYRFNTNLQKILNGTSPKRIDARNPHSIYNINLWLAKRNLELIVADDTYYNNEKEMTFRKINSNIEYKCSWKYISNCKDNDEFYEKCNGRSARITNKSLLFSEFLDRLQAIKWQLDEVISEDDFYVNGKYQVKSIEGYISKISLYSLRGGAKPLILFISKNQDHYLYDENLKLITSKLSSYELVDGQVYTSVNSKYKFKCQHHGEFTSVFKKIIDGESACKKCIKFGLISMENTRNSEAYEEWRNSVLKRDKYTCQGCNSVKNLEVHHKDAYHWNKKRRLDITNGVVLCRYCHRDGKNSFHTVYGTIMNTELDYNEWLVTYKDALTNRKRRI